MSDKKAEKMTKTEFTDNISEASVLIRGDTQITSQYNVGYD